MKKTVALVAFIAMISSPAFANNTENNELSSEDMAQVVSGVITLKSQCVNKSEYVRDVSHTKAVQNAITHNRDRFITEGDHISPALARCQSRQVKDSVYIKHKGMYFYPRVKLQRDLMSIPDSFDLSLVIDDVASEFIGNSVEAPQHTAILKKIRTHLLKGIQKLVPRRNMAQVAFSF